MRRLRLLTRHWYPSGPGRNRSPGLQEDWLEPVQPHLNRYVTSAALPSPPCPLPMNEFRLWFMGLLCAQLVAAVRCEWHNNAESDDE